MKVRFYTSFPKRNNSTKQISSEAYTELELVLKEATSIENPAFLISGDHFDYTYAYIADWNRYYFVDQILSSAKGLTQITLKEDYLASWKTNVGSTIAHIVYSSTGWDKDIVDSRLPVLTTKKIEHDPVNPGIFDGDGLFLLSITNVQSSANGFATTYICNRNTLDNVANILMNMDITSMVIKSIYRPFDCIISCTWLPLKYSTFSGGSYCDSSDNIYFGEYDSGIPGNKLVSPLYSNFATFSMTPRYDDFRAMQPYTTYSMLIPMYGVIDLNASDIRKLLKAGGFSVGYEIDLASGDMTCGIFTKAGVIGQSINCNIGVNCPIAQTSNNMTGTIASIGGVAGGVIGAIGMGVTGNIPGALAAGAGVLAGAAGTALSANTRATSIKGGINGRSILALGASFDLMEYAMDTEDPTDANYIARWGRPVGLTHAISNHSGYVQCEGASVSINGLDSERETINSYLNSGFYYE